MTVSWHACCAEGRGWTCIAAVVPPREFCQRHWGMLPKAMQHRIFDCWKNASEGGYDALIAEAIQVISKVVETGSHRQGR